MSQVDWYFAPLTTELFRPAAVGEIFHAAYILAKHQQPGLSSYGLLSLQAPESYWAAQLENGPTGRQHIEG